jgi:hypothetical protein
LWISSIPKGKTTNSKTIKGNLTANQNIISFLVCQRLIVRI